MVCENVNKFGTGIKSKIELRSKYRKKNRKNEKEKKKNEKRKKWKIFQYK